MIGAEEPPLSGLTVFDATQGVAGPHGTLLMAQFGADVIKVEPLQGDWGRHIGRVYGGQFCANAVAVNRGKRSIAVDFKSPAGLEVARRLAAGADIVVENFRPGVMARYGLDDATLRAARPDLIYASVTGYGQRGPYRDRGVSDTVMQAFSGLMSINKDAEGTPRRLGMIAIDVVTGLYLFQAVAAAVLARFRFGRGATIDCNMMQAAAAFQAAKIMEHHLEGAANPVLVAPVGEMPTADGWLNVSGVKQAHYEALCGALGRPDLITDPRFRTNADRVARVEEITAIVQAEFRKRPTAEWCAILTEAGVMHAPVADYGDFLTDPHVKAVAAVVMADQPGMGPVPHPNVPGAAPIDPASPLARAPRLGEHGAEILAAAGYGAGEIAELVARGAVAGGR